VRFFPGNGEETPARAEQVVGDEDELQAGEAIPGDDEVQMVRLPVEIKTREIVLKDGFVTPREIDAAGTLVASYAESEMLSPPDVVYLDFKDRSAVQVGASYLVYRTVGEVHHPRTGKFLGYQTQILGTVKVKRTSEPKVRAVLDRALDEIRRGDRIGPARERLYETVAPVPNAVALQNLTVVAQLEPSLTMAGEHVRVLVDAGSAQGVQVGNVFTVIRQVDPITSGVGVDQAPIRTALFRSRRSAGAWRWTSRDGDHLPAPPLLPRGGGGGPVECVPAGHRRPDSLAKVRIPTGPSRGPSLDPVGAGAYVSPPLSGRSLHFI
jgi:hypothetical protein